MKNTFFLFLFNFAMMVFVYPQAIEHDINREQAIRTLIDNYAMARQQKDSLLLGRILTKDIDQLVSSGKWRKGRDESMTGMLQSSVNNPGTRTLQIENIRFLNPHCGIVDARYVIQNIDGTSRKMWSTFIVVQEAGDWKISAIRNMLPAIQNK